MKNFNDLKDDIIYELNNLAASEGMKMQNIVYLLSKHPDFVPQALNYINSALRQKNEFQKRVNRFTVDLQGRIDTIKQTLDANYYDTSKEFIALANKDIKDFLKNE